MVMTCGKLGAQLELYWTVKLVCETPGTPLPSRTLANGAVVDASVVRGHSRREEPSWRRRRHPRQSRRGGRNCSCRRACSGSGSRRSAKPAACPAIAPWSGSGIRILHRGQLLVLVAQAEADGQARQYFPIVLNEAGVIPGMELGADRSECLRKAAPVGSRLPGNRAGF